MKTYIDLNKRKKFKDMGDRVGLYQAVAAGLILTVFTNLKCKVCLSFFVRNFRKKHLRFI
jgi:hypothetical protein